MEIVVNKYIKRNKRKNNNNNNNMRIVKLQIWLNSNNQRRDRELNQHFI